MDAAASNVPIVAVESVRVWEIKGRLVFSCTGNRNNGSPMHMLEKSCKSGAGAGKRYEEAMKDVANALLRKLWKI